MEKEMKERLDFLASKFDIKISSADLNEFYGIVLENDPENLIDYIKVVQRKAKALI